MQRHITYSAYLMAEEKKELERTRAVIGSSISTYQLHAISNMYLSSGITPFISMPIEQMSLVLGPNLNY